MEMERQAGFLLALLFLANFLTIGADSSGRIQYIGYSNALLNTTPWKITCLGLTSSDAVAWTRNGESIQQEIDEKEITQEDSPTNSTISASLAKLKHGGQYKCTKNSTFSHTLTVHSEANGGASTQTPQSDSSLTSKVASASNQNELIYAYTEKNLILPCNLTTVTTGSITWTHNNATLKETDTLKLSKDRTQLNITKGLEDYMGNYTCSAGSGMPTRFMKVVPYPIVKLPSLDTNVVEGEKLRLTCEVTPGLGAEIEWIFDNVTYTKGTERINITTEEKSSTLTVYDIRQEDRGNVTCKVVFTRTVDQFASSYTTLLRVTNKFAALWPFLGICAEVIVLCAIILVYEKKRNKAELEESDTDQSPDTKPTPNKDSEVRQRK
ncbi:basigin isoform X1 [Neodiprion pinetum]|uniref:Neuroplastin isoform X1 n=1 Tax=Neodiprion lecontei TaxID=441921 RepID=A0A6J0BIL1_NEOLC|nr:neuroplastin isoform X1 [Neodiprion lecontei]XP_046483422.1 neuroplastin isoform X1 [Neodiprion pinetum]